MMAEILEDVISLSRPIEDVFAPGLYFLFQGDRLVYIGQSNSVPSRIAQHIMEGIKDFDRFTSVTIADRRRRLDLEKDLVASYRPYYNVTPLAEMPHLIRYSQVEIPDEIRKKYPWGNFIKRHKIPYEYNDQRDPYVRKAAIYEAIKNELEQLS
jgi:hypothetical protein